MKMRHSVLPLILSSMMVLPALAQVGIPDDRPVTMFTLPANGKDEPLTIGVHLSDQAVNETFADLRSSIQADQLQQRNAKFEKVSLKRFSIESASFFVAIAAVQFEALMVNFSDNPRALQDHLESVKDPIGHLSFYMFMQANGYASYYLTKKLPTNMDPLSKAQAMRSITYKGMAAGSIVSSLTAEVATGVRDCSKYIFENEKDAKAEKAKVCEAAYKQWTRSTKAQQYVAQIISLFVSQDAATFLETKGRNGVSIATKDVLARAVKSTSTRKAFQVTALQVAMMWTPGGLVAKSFAAVGKITQFAAFTYIDHLMAPFVHKAVANVWQPAQFDFDVMSFNSNVFEAKREFWRNDRSNKALAENLVEMTKTMSEWRQAQLVDFETSHGIWVSSLLKVISQTSGTYGFYGKYLENLFSTENVQSQIRSGTLPPSAMNIENGYPQRTLPLFGVKLAKPMPEDYDSETDLTLSKPSDLENEQIATVKKVNVQLKALLSTKGLHEHDAELLTQIAQGFDSADLMVVGAAIVKLNDVVIYNKRFVTDAGLKARLVDIRKQLGNPYPILTPGLGFSYAYETHSFNTEAMKTFDHSQGPGRWLPRTSDYLLLQMICGGEANLLSSNMKGFAPYFISPKITNSNVRPTTLCSSLNLQNLYSMKIPATDGKTYNGITDYINQNLRKEVLGDVNVTDDKITVFADWWKMNVNIKLGEMYKNYDSEYMKVIAKLTQNWRGYGIANCAKMTLGKCIGKIANVAVDQLNQSDFLERNALSNLKYELDIYTAVMNEMAADTAEVNAVISNSVQRNLPGALNPLKNSIMSQVELKPALPSLQDENAKKALELKMAQVGKTKKEFAGFLRRLKSGDRTILQGKVVAELPELKALRIAIEERLVILGKIEVQDGVFLNFPEKEDSKKAIEHVEEALKAFQKRCESFSVSESQKAVLSAAIQGIQSVSLEVSRLNMALYTSKYKLSDSYEEIKAGYKGSQSEKKAPARGFNPNGTPR